MTDDQRGEGDLRRRVDELEATVRGLTQELVEANERIRQLEDRLEDGEDPDFIEADGTDEESADEADEPEEAADHNMGVAPQTEAEIESEEVEEDEEEDDIIVA